MTTHLGRWLRRYLPAEIISLAAALVCSQLCLSASGGNIALAAVAGAWGETLAYYATMLFRELRTTAVLLAARNLVLEFGMAEALDSLVIRPGLMYAATQLVGDIAVGVVLGKFAANIFFYIPTIAAFELRRRYLPANS